MTKPTTARACIVEDFSAAVPRPCPATKITVSQLTKKAGYNRSTFYAYFNNTDDLLKQLENELFQLVETFLPHGFVFSVQACLQQKNVCCHKDFLKAMPVFWQCSLVRTAIRVLSIK